MNKQEEPLPVIEEKDPMAPSIVEVVENKNILEVVPVMQEKPEKEEKEILHLEITSLPSSSPESVEKSTASGAAQTFEPSPGRFNNNTINKEASTTPTSGGYLSKPSNIYAEEPEQSSNSVEEPSPVQHHPSSDGKMNEMHIVIKDSGAADEPLVQTTQGESRSVEDPAMQDEAEEQKRRAAERLNKLRNLSYNSNPADPTNEFETVPAYVRRNFHLKDALASVEKFYSNYTVKKDENDQTQISTINTFLDGKRPD